MAKITAPKGTVDILPDQCAKWQAVESIARQLARLYHFSEIRTPIFEHTELFHRGVGETTDIVHKETYTFTDRGGRSLTLRPEQTAGVVRAAIENGLLSDPGTCVKLFYIGPNFRYENVQKGRLRQHHQFGAEIFGAAEPEADVECILLQLDFYRRCGIKDLQLRLNSLGDRESKQRFAEHIREKLSSRKHLLSVDSQRRLDENPLRILDSKDPRDVEQTSDLVGLDFLSEKSKAHLDRVQALLCDAGVGFVLDGKLVRGFDYYTDTLWEVTASGLGAQNALGGGGRYDNLVETLGGRPTPGVGFGSGIERLLIALDAQGASLPIRTVPLVWIVRQHESARQACMRLLADLRAAGIAADMDFAGRSVKSQFKLADRQQAAWVVVIGESELASNTVSLKNMSSGEQISVPRASIVEHLNNAKL